MRTDHHSCYMLTARDRDAEEAERSLQHLSTAQAENDN
jgi:hypothetical protein